MPLIFRHAEDYNDTGSGTIWYRTDGRAEVCVLRVYEQHLVRIQYLNNRRVFRILSMDEFRGQWTHQPRIDIAWFNVGSTWKRIHKMDRNGMIQLEDRTIYNLERLLGNKVHFDNSERLSVLDASLNFVRLWPMGVTFPETAETSSTLTPKKSREPKTRATMWERLDKDLFDDN